MAHHLNYDLSDVFKRLSDRYFVWSGSELCIRGGRLEELHELALRFPVRHLVRHQHARAVAAGILTRERALRLSDNMTSMHTTSQGIRAVVERGLSEGHLHLSGVTSAHETWADQLLRRLPPGVLKNHEPQEHRLLILSRAGAQMLALGVLHALLDAEASAPPYKLVQLLDLLYRAAGRRPEHSVHAAWRKLFREVLNKTPCFESMPGETEAQKLEWLLPIVDPTVHFLWQSRRRVRGSPFQSGIIGLRQRLEQVDRLHFEVQLLLIRLTAPGLGRSPKSRKSHQAWATGMEESPLRRYLHAVFFRYLIYNTHHWNLATQNGKTTGLRQFKTYFGARQRELLGSEVEAQGLVLDRLAENRVLNVVEARVSPPKGGAAELVPWILGSARRATWRHLKKFGLVLHFIKQDHQTAESEQRRQGKQHQIDSLRHRQIRYETKQRAMEVFRLLSTPHPVVPFIVGIDAANLELTTPPEVFAPAFRFLREFPIELRKRSFAGQKLAAIPEIHSLVDSRRLGMTYHVGEDFRHLLSGLRAIHEVVQFLRPQPGDRLGHAIALALDPEVWASQIGFQAVLPKLEWLDNLVWVHHLLGPGHDLLGELAIEDSIHRLSCEIYQSQEFDKPLVALPPTLYDAWLLRQLDPIVQDHVELGTRPIRASQRILGTQERRWKWIQDRVLREVQRKVGSRDAYKLLALYWHDHQVRRRGGEIITVDLQEDRDKWIQVCLEAQARLQEEIKQAQIVIEINPSSNRVIGPMFRFSEHPIFRVTLDENKRLSRFLRFTVNTDDPGVFSTSLAHEYYLLAEILLARGVPEGEVVEWLEWLRTCGNDYSFLRCLPEFTDPRVQTAVEELRRMNRSLLPRLDGKRRSHLFRRRSGANRRHGSQSDSPSFESDASRTSERIREAWKRP